MSSIPWADSGKFTRHTNWAQGWGMTRYGVATAITASAYTTIGTGAQFLNDAHSQNPNTMENLGYGTGAAIGEGLVLVTMGITAADAYRSRGSNLKNPAFQATMYKDKLYRNPNTIVGPRTGTKVKNAPRAKTGLFRGGKFIKPMSWKKDISLGIGAMLTGMVASAGLGMVGRYIDGNIAEHKRRSVIDYDSRFFDTRRYDQATNNQVGMAMQNYSDRLVSVARIHHSR